MAIGTETPKKKPYKDRPVGLLNTERDRAIAAEYEDAPPFTLAPNTEASRRSREERMVAQEMASAPAVNTAAPSSTPQPQLSVPPPSLPGNPQPTAFGSGAPALGSLTPLPGPTVAPSQTPQLDLADPPPNPVGQPTPYQGSGPEAILPNTVAAVSATPPRGVPAAATVLPERGLDPRQNPARFEMGFEDARVNQGDGRTDIFRSEQGVQRQGGEAGYQRSIFEGPAIDQARQLPGLPVPQENNVSRVVTDANGRVVGYARNWQTPEDAQNASGLANPNGIQTPELSPIEQRDYERAVAEARQSPEERIAPSTTPGFVNPSITRERTRDREAAEARGLGVRRSLDISDFNQGRNPSLNAISDAEVALAPGGFSSVGVNPELRRERVERGMSAELPDFLPTDMRDRLEARRGALGPRLEGREREQAELEGLSSSNAFESAFGPMNDRRDRRLSTRQLQEAIELARRLSAQT